jgi:hypothetical protein
MTDRPCPCLRVSDHALLQLLQRAGGLDVDGLRASIQASLKRSIVAAGAVGVEDYEVRADGLRYVVKRNVLVTVTERRRR